MYKKVNVVMLPTNEKAKIYTDRYGNLKVHSTESTLPLDSIGKNQHLYILSDEEIKEGDWFINPKPGYKPKRFKKKSEWDGVSVTKCFKIIATTDNLWIINNKGSQRIAEIHQSFIEYFISEYNKGNIITEVMVEYNESITEIPKPYKPYSEIQHLDGTLKINPDNTINIKPIKDSWNIKEIEEIHVSVVKQGCLYEGGTWSDEHERLVRLEFNKWIEENI